MPLIFVSDITGLFFRALAITLGGGLAISLMLAIFFTPALEEIIGRWRRPSRPPARCRRDARRVCPLAVLRSALAPPPRPFFIAAFVLYRAVGTDYLPALDEGAFTLDYITPAPSTLDDTNALLSKIEDILRTTPEVAAFSRRTGTQLGFFLTESDRGDFSVLLKRQRSRSIDEIMNDVRRRIMAAVPGVHIEFSQVLQDLSGDLSGVPQPIEVKVFGADQASIETTARRIAAEISTVPGVVDVFDGIVVSSPEEQIVINQSAAARYGLTAEDIRATLETAIGQSAATQLMSATGPSACACAIRQTSIATCPRSQKCNSARSPAPWCRSAPWPKPMGGETTELTRAAAFSRRFLHGAEGVDLGTALGEIHRGSRRWCPPKGVSPNLALY